MIMKCVLVKHDQFYSFFKSKREKKTGSGISGLSIFSKFWFFCAFWWSNFQLAFCTWKPAVQCTKVGIHKDDTPNLLIHRSAYPFHHLSCLSNAISMYVPLVERWLLQVRWNLHVFREESSRMLTKCTIAIK